jgi:hypothetical protein
MSAASASYPGDFFVGATEGISAFCCASQLSTEDVVASAPTAKVGAVVITGVGTVVAGSAESTVIVWVAEFVLLPSEFVAVRVTV